MGMKSTLLQRFETFMGCLARCENVNDLLRSNDPRGKFRADYMLGDRSVVVEQKSLEADPTPKAQKFADKLASDRKLVFYGKMTTTELFSRQPDANALNAQLFQRITRSIESQISHADKQTRDTKEIFNVPEAAGLLIFLNETVDALDPEVVAARALQMLSQRDGVGDLRYRHNQAVLLFQETHVVVGGALPERCCPFLRGPNLANYPKLEETALSIVADWAKFNGASFSGVASADRVRDVFSKLRLRRTC